MHDRALLENNQGVETFPASLFDVPKLLSLGDYYMNDVPEMPVDPSVYPV